MNKIAMTALGVLAAASLCAAGGNLNFSAPVMRKAPLLDGKISPGEWEETLSFDGVRQHNGGALEWRRARAFIGTDGKALYLALETELPEDRSLVTGKQRKGVQACFEDIAEFFVDPAPDAASGINYHLLVNAAGNADFDALPRGKAEKPDWSRSGVEFRQSKGNGNWTVEVKFPLTLFKRGIAGSPWGISICRSWMRPLVFSSIPGQFNGGNVRIVFSRENPALAFRWNKDPFLKHIDMTLAVRNTAQTRRKFRFAVLLTNNHMPDSRKEEDLQLNPGEAANLRFDSRLTGNTCTDFKLSLSLKDESGKELIPLQHVWTVPPRKLRWVIASAPVSAFDFEFAHYPYARKLRIENMLRSYKGRIPEKIPVSLVERETGKTVWKNFLPGKDGAISEFTVPELNGKYRLLFDMNGATLEKELERKHFEWENNKLGLSRKVYPPFTPMTVGGRTIGTVLREHRLAETGLPEQITVKGVDLLASGSRILANGEAVSGSLSFREKAEDCVRTSSILTGKGFSAVASGRWEYDGALKYDLTLQPGRVERLTVEIPLKGELIPVAYAGMMRDIRLKRLEQRPGILWKSTDVPLVKNMPEGFCNYLYLGSAHRGLCFFAENDRNWGWKHGTPNLEVERKGGELILRIHLVNAPLAVTEARTLSFGLLAAPVKPRPADWATRWIDNKYTVLGTDVNWLGGPGCCACVYPPGREMIFWEALAKANTEPVRTPAQREERKKTADSLIRIADRYFKAYDVPDYQKGYNRTVYHRIVRGASYGRSMIFYYNRSVYNGLDEYPTFMNEWTAADFESRRYVPSINEIFIIPSKSYIDYSLYWHRKSFRYRNNGIYWDNMMIVPTYNTEMTDAYRAADGSVVPAAGIWQMREMVKRAFVMMCEEGMAPVTLPHMTSLSILPLLSFATYQLDWEWKRSAGPVQTRFSRDYCQIVSHGELAGVTPFVCNDAGPLADREDIQRSFAGVTLVHMLDRYNFVPTKPLKSLNLAVHAQYLHDPALETFRYWDERKCPDFSVGNGEIAWIIHRVPGKKALLGLCSYSGRKENVGIRCPAGWSVSNFETGGSVATENGRLTLKLNPYEVLALEFKNRERNEK